MEIWKEVPEFKGLILVSNLQRIKHSKDHYFIGDKKVKRNFVFIKKHIGTDDYYKVTIQINCKVYYRRFCRLMCSAFHENPLNLTQVNHDDLNKLNDDPSNIYWCTPGQNVEHARKNIKFKYNPTFGTKNPKAKLTDEIALEIKNSPLSTRKAGLKYGVHSSIVQGIRSGKRWPHLSIKS